jgi:uncharacterized protein YqhQ
MSAQSIGGQAVIEGVMMKAKTRLSVAVRLPSGKIAVKIDSCASTNKIFPFLSWPFLRGPVVLLETMVLGLKALAFSASLIMEEEGEQLRPWSMVIAMIGAFAAGMGLFVALPHMLTWLLGEYSAFHYNTQSLSFHIIDGILKIIIFVGYIWAISFMEQVRRVFAYHGAEHKTIHCLESGQPLTVENAQKCSRLHNRCGTTFLLLVLVISIAAFAVIFPWLPPLAGNAILNQTAQIILKMACMFPIAGIAYEIIRLAGKKRQSYLWRLLLMPGLQLQRLTTREPDESQLQTAIVALEAALSTSEISEDIHLVETKDSRVLAL